MFIENPEGPRRRSLYRVIPEIQCYYTGSIGFLYNETSNITNNEDIDNGFKIVYNNIRYEIVMEFKHVQSLQTEKYKTLLRDFKSLNK